jgi:hypothetical protein
MGTISSVYDCWFLAFTCLPLLLSLSLSSVLVFCFLEQRQIIDVEDVSGTDGLMNVLLGFNCGHLAMSSVDGKAFTKDSLSLLDTYFTLISCGLNAT